MSHAQRAAQPSHAGSAAALPLLAEDVAGDEDWALEVLDANHGAHRPRVPVHQPSVKLNSTLVRVTTACATHRGSRAQYGGLPEESAHLPGD